MAALSVDDLQSKREYFKENYGIDIMSKSGRLLLKNEEYKRDTKKYINDIVKIEDKDKKGVVIDFKLWPEQEEVLALLERELRNIILKARQLGLTWEVLAFASHELIYNAGFSVNSISQTEGDTKELVRRMGFILKYLPNWLIIEDKAKEEEKSENITGIYYSQQKLEIVIYRPDGEPSIFKGFTSSPGAARSFTANIIILDEWAFHPDAQGIWDAAYPTINRPTGGKVIGLSTGEMGTFFETMWQGASWSFGGESGAGRNSFVGIFLPWDVDPRRDRKWYEQTRRDMPHTYKREYPATPAEAFSAGKGAMFLEWDARIHVPYGKSWYPPGSWRIVMGYDGGFNQSACKWYAISPDGWVVCYREYYPSFTIDPIQAEDIRMLSKDPDGVPEQIDYIIADTSCWVPDKQTGESTVEIMENRGIRPWRPADKDRIMGWNRLHEWLAPIKDEQGNYILDRYGDKLVKLRYTASCSNHIRLVSGMKVNPNKPDDLDGRQEDHLFDVDRYFVMSRPRPKVSAKQRERSRKRRQRRIKPRSGVTGY
jgi:hypothetical protein